MSETAAYEYYAFISYKRGEKDETYAKWLQNKLESFRIPTEIASSDKTVPKRIKVFRDKTDLGSHANLQQGLATSLSKSRFLIVVCSPRSAESPYVDDEVRFFQEQGRGAQVIPFIINGTPVPKEGEQQCYPPSLSTNILGVTLTEGSQEEALIKVVARLLEVDYATLYQRHLRAQKHFYAKMAAGALGVIISLLLLLVWAVSAEQRATVQRIKAEQAEQLAVAQRKEAESLVKFLTFDLRDEAFAHIPLKAQQKIMETVEAYYSKWKSESLVGTYTRTVHLDNQARSLMTEGKLAEALILAEKAKAVLNIFLQHYPDNPLLIKDMATLCGNVGAVLVLQGKEQEAGEMFAQSQSLFKRALAADPANLDLRLRLLRLAGAQFGFNDARLQKKNDTFVHELRVLYEQTQDMAGTLPLIPEFFELTSYFCQVLPMEDWKKRKEFCTQAVEIAEALHKSDPYNLILLTNVEEAFFALASLEFERSDYAAAVAFQEKCVAVNRLLTERDSSNINFQQRYGVALQLLGAYEEHQGKMERGKELRREAKAILENVHNKTSGKNTLPLTLLQVDLDESRAYGITTNPERVKPTASGLKKARDFLKEHPENIGGLLSLTLALLNHGTALNIAGMYAQALPVGRELVALLHTLIASQDTMHEGLRVRLFLTHLMLGKAYQEMSNFEEAKLAYESALAVAQPHAGTTISAANLEEVSMALSYLSRLFEREGKISEALAYSEKTLDIDRQRYHNMEDSIPSGKLGALAMDYAYAATLLGVQWLSCGNYEKGIQFLLEAVAPGKEGMKHDSGFAQGQKRSFYSSILSYLILAYAEIGHHEKAMTLAAEAETLYPAGKTFRSNTASLANVQFRLYRSIALALLLHDDPEKALKPAHRASEASRVYYSASIKTIGDIPKEFAFYAWATELKILRLAGKTQDALALLEETAPLCRELMLTPGVEIAGDAAGSVLIDGALVNLSLGRIPEARRLSEEAAILIRAKWRKNPQEVDTLQTMGHLHFAQGGIAAAEGRKPEAIALYEQSLKITNSLLQLEARHVGWRKEYIIILQHVGALYHENGNDERAKECKEELARLLR